MDIKSIAAKYEDYVIEMRRRFHARSEVSLREVEVGKRIREELTKMGVEWRDCGPATDAPPIRKRKDIAYEFQKCR